MASKQHLTAAAYTYVGASIFQPMVNHNERKGAPVTWITKVDLGSPIALNATGLVASATSTELPNNATKTYTAATSGTSPLDDAGIPTPVSKMMDDALTYLVWPLDVPRNLSLVVTHGTSIVALSCTITGFDQWGQKMVETLSVTATGTTKTSAGKKAFAYVYSIAFTSAGNATTDTATLGWGDVLGLPYTLQMLSDTLGKWFNNTVDTGTFAKGDATTATATTGDVRGTYTPGSANDGSPVAVWYHVDATTPASLAGIAQYAG